MDEGATYNLSAGAGDFEKQLDPTDFIGIFEEDYGTLDGSSALELMRRGYHRDEGAGDTSTSYGLEVTEEYDTPAVPYEMRILEEDEFVRLDYMSVEEQGRVVLQKELHATTEEFTPDELKELEEPLIPGLVESKPLTNEELVNRLLYLFLE